MKTRFLLIALVALAVLAGGAILGRVGGSTPAAPSTGGSEPAAGTDAVDVSISPADLLAQQVATTQEQLRRVPGDWTSWAALGMEYLEESRVTLDPTYYPKASQAVQRSLSIHPDDNTDALVARGAIENAQHQFAKADRDAKAVLAIDAYSADAYAVLTDAETQLGHPAAATAAAQHLVDLKPGLSAYSRASYDFEQRGMVDAAKSLMTQALNASVDRSDISFCDVQLGDLAFSVGDLASADADYTAGLAADPTSAALQRSKARLDAAQGRTDQAVREYDELTKVAPNPVYLLEYADLLTSLGRTAEAKTQIKLAAAEQQLFVDNGGIDGMISAQIDDEQGNYASAVSQAAAEWSRRQFADVADTYAWALHLEGQDSKALVYAQKAYGTGARNALYAYHLGMIEMDLGHKADAAKYLKQTLSINSSFSPTEAPAARAALAEVSS